MAYAWFEGYEVYIVDNKGYPFKVCNESGLTNKQLRPEHNIFKIFAAGGFGSQFLE